MDQVIQVVGAVMVLIAYTASQTGRWSPQALPYLWLNLVGSAILAVLAAMSENWGFLLLEAVWTVVTGWSLFKQRREARAPARTT
jgi:hypothetical protein